MNTTPTPPTDSPKPPAADNAVAEFFIGYAPMPAALKRLYWPLAIIAIIACGVAGFWFAAQQHAVGGGHWTLGAPSSVTGLLTRTPYPAVHHLTEDGVQTTLLVRQGKHSVNEWAAAFDGQLVRVRGNSIERGAWAMLEIGVDAIRAADLTDKKLLELPKQLDKLVYIDKLGEVDLKGEIVDSKCFLGVMKPGAGLLHKACAEICLRGGIPPILRVKNADGIETGYLLARADGGDASKLLAPLAAEPVRITGQLSQYGNLSVIKVDLGGVRRLP